MILPLASCGEVRLRGADILFMDTRPGVKLLVAAAAVAAVLAIFIAGADRICNDISGGAIGRWQTG